MSSTEKQLIEDYETNKSRKAYESLLVKRPRTWCDYYKSLHSDAVTATEHVYVSSHRVLLCYRASYTTVPAMVNCYRAFHSDAVTAREHHLLCPPMLHLWATLSHCYRACVCVRGLNCGWIASMPCSMSHKNWASTPVDTYMCVDLYFPSKRSEEEFLLAFLRLLNCFLGVGRRRSHQIH